MWNAVLCSDAASALVNHEMALQTGRSKRDSRIERDRAGQSSGPAEEFE